MRYWNAFIKTLGPGAEFSFVALKPYGTNVRLINASSFARDYARQDENIDELNSLLPPPPPSGSILYVTLYALLFPSAVVECWIIVRLSSSHRTRSPRLKGEVTPSARLAR